MSLPHKSVFVKYQMMATIQTKEQNTLVLGSIHSNEDGYRSPSVDIPL
jgi:hypothetical protein